MKTTSVIIGLTKRISTLENTIVRCWQVARRKKLLRSLCWLQVEDATVCRSHTRGASVFPRATVDDLTAMDAVCLGVNGVFFIRVVLRHIALPAPRPAPSLPLRQRKISACALATTVDPNNVKSVWRRIFRASAGSCPLPSAGTAVHPSCRSPPVAR